ncbi:helix-turn-helix transcriptional regulator [Botrimarina mediterranea]|uniref:helix-turn-helix transcriptional regulator n=1 Tax=Botrimarina mediterranea TaxID=2528022 RepID=UPI00118874D2|nr:Helix-turn-helix domain protein [Planctomycetes bacterium K2D]
MNDPQEPLLLTAVQVAGLLQVSSRTVWRLVSERKIVGPVRIGGATRWRRDEVERWIGAGCPASTGGEQSSRR